jgi:hypothetical protein
METEFFLKPSLILILNFLEDILIGFVKHPQPDSLIIPVTITNFLFGNLSHTEFLPVTEA